MKKMLIFTKINIRNHICCSHFCKLIEICSKFSDELRIVYFCKIIQMITNIEFSQ